GQGTQWVGMGRDLLGCSPVFAARMGECAAVLDPLTGWSLLEVLDDGEALRRVDVVQPVVFAVMVSLAAVWESCGVTPDAVVGHSQGEIAAAVVAGALSLEDAATVVVARSRALTVLSGQGGMASIGLSEAEAAESLAEWPGLSIAAVNGPDAVVVAGDGGELERFVASCSDQGVRARLIEVDYASHSSQVDGVADALRAELAEVPVGTQRIAMMSSVTAGWIGSDGVAPDGDYWVRNLREKVRFHDAIRNLVAEGFRCFVEISSHPVLTPGIEAACENAEVTASVVGTLRRDDGGAARLLRSLGEAWTAGLPVTWPITPGQPIDLPTYAFQHRRYWLTPRPAPAESTVDGEFWKLVEQEDVQTLADSLAVEAEPLRDMVRSLRTWHRGRRSRSVIDSWRYRESWHPLTVPAEGSPAGKWLLLLPDSAAGPAREAATAVADGFGESAEVLVVPDGGDGAELAEWFRALDGVAGVLSLLALDERAHPVHAAMPSGFVHNLLALRAMTDAGVDAPLWWATRGAVSLGAADPVLGAEQAMTWGTGRVAALEYARRWGGLVDLPATVDERAVALLRGVLASGSGEDQVAVRAAGAFGRRLVRAPQAGAEKAPWRPRGTVLITGGTGALGARVARWAAANGAEHLVLTGRRGPDAPGAAALAAELRESGAGVTVAACDAADRAAVAALLAGLPADRPLTAVVHAAGIAEVGMLAETTVPEFARTLTGKAAGARNLHELTAGLDLDAFVLFSSGSASWGSAGNAAYAAGNAYLDGLAQVRRAAGLPATSVAWGNWGGGGLTAGAGEEALTRRGVRAMDPDTAVRALAQAVGHGETLLTIADLDWERFAPPFALGRPSPLIGEIPEARDALAGAAADEGATTGLRRRLAELTAPERRRLVSVLVGTEIAAVLGYAGPDDVEPDRPFQEVGFDSVTAVELRNRLTRKTGTPLPATVVFDHPTPAAITELLLATLVETDAAPRSRLDVLDELAREMAAADHDGDTRRQVVVRLQTLIAKLSENGTGNGAANGLDGASDEELFGFIDNDLGVS
ncbi:SDR family NAD(P)-dependent oxidoreductase, partial [Actinomadura rugatobispora]